MPPSLYPAPSTALLRFLRAQADGAFGTANALLPRASRSLRRSSRFKWREATCQRAAISTSSLRATSRTTSPAQCTLGTSKSCLTKYPTPLLHARCQSARYSVACNAPAQNAARLQFISFGHGLGKSLSPTFYISSIPRIRKSSTTYAAFAEQQILQASFLRIDALVSRFRAHGQRLARMRHAWLDSSRLPRRLASSTRSTSHQNLDSESDCPTSPAAPVRRKWWDLKTRLGHHGSVLEQHRGAQGVMPFQFTTDSNGATLVRVKGPNELKLRCTELDENGKVTIVDGEFRKQELIARYGLLPRDLRKIDSSMLPSIIVRPTVILINLLHLRVLIKHDRVLVFDVYGSTDSLTQSIFMYDLQGKLSQQESSSARGAAGLPYEFRALEAILISVTSGLEGEFDGVREPVVQVLRELEEDIDREKLRHLLIYSKKLGTFEQKARLVRDAIDGLLEDDDDLSTMYLTEQVRGKKRDAHDHSEIEMLLESYHKVTDEIVQSSATLVNDIRNTEEIVKAILDANRNALMLLSTKFSIGTLGIGSGAFVAALYGMNLKNFIEESNFGFWGVSGVSAVAAIVVCIYGISKLRRVQHMRMWGESGERSRGSWRQMEPWPMVHRDPRREREKAQRRLEKELRKRRDG